MAKEKTGWTRSSRARGELDLLKALWAIGSGSVREVRKQMCPDGELAFNTVQTRAADHGRQGADPPSRGGPHIYL